MAEIFLPKQRALNPRIQTPDAIREWSPLTFYFMFIQTVRGDTNDETEE